MKASIHLFWLRVFRRKDLRKVAGSYMMLEKYSYGCLINGSTKEGDECVRYIKDGWGVKTDGLYPKHLIIRDRIVSFFNLTVPGWYIDFTRYVCHKFPKWAKRPSNDIWGKLLFLPLKLWGSKFYK